MRSGLTIKLPEEDPVLAWSRLATRTDTAITERDLAAIDLRVPGSLWLSRISRSEAREQDMIVSSKMARAAIGILDIGSSKLAV